MKNRETPVVEWVQFGADFGKIRSMCRILFFSLIAFLAAFAGCRAIERAREAQESVVDVASDGAQCRAVVRFDPAGKSLSSLVEYAITNRPSFANAALAVDSARITMREIAADAPLISDHPWNSPHLSVSGAYSERTEAQSAKGFSFKTERGSPSAALSLDLLIYDFGRYEARANAQAHRVVAAELDLVNEGYSVFGEVSESYFTLLEKQALAEVAVTNLHECSVRADYEKERLENGEAKSLDLMRAKLDLAKAAENCVNATNALLTAGAEFLKSIGVEASGGMPSGGWNLGATLNSARRGFGDTFSSADEIFELARTNAPSMRVVRAKLRAASADVDYAIANTMPTLSASASLSWTDPLWTFGWGLSAAQSLFEGFRKTSAIDKAVVSMRQAEKAVEEAEQKLSRDVELAVAARDNAREALRTADDSLKTARENLDLVRRQFELGEANRVDFTEALSDYAEALGGRVSAFYRGQRAEAAIFALTGTYPAYDEKNLTEEN